MKMLHDDQLLQQYIEKADGYSLLDSSLKQYMTLALFDQDEYIYQQEDELEHLYIFVQGTIKVSYVSENGKETIFRILKQPRFMGEIELLLDSPATCTIQALDPVYCILLPLRNCRDVLLADPVFLRYISRNLAEALYISNNSTSINQNYTPKNRLISYILSIERNSHFYIDLNIATNILGISERHVFRLLSDLIQNELIEKGAGGYRILQKEELIALADTRYIL